MVYHVQSLTGLDATTKYCYVLVFYIQTGAHAYSNTCVIKINLIAASG